MSEQSNSPAAISHSNELGDSEFVFRSTEQSRAIRLSHKTLSIMLMAMCIVPAVTIGILWATLPAVEEGQLNAKVVAQGLPDADFYAIEYYDRPPVEGGVLIVENCGDLDWTHLINIQVNGHYQIYDTDTFPAHSKKTYKLNRFLNRTGARFSLQYNELNRVRIYARRPSKDRATFYHEFPSTQDAKDEKKL